MNPDTLATFLERLGRSRCLASTARTNLETWAATRASEGELRDFMRGPLPYFERHVASVDHPAFIELCDIMARQVDGGKACTALAEFAFDGHAQHGLGTDGINIDAARLFVFGNGLLAASAGAAHPDRVATKVRFMVSTVGYSLVRLSRPERAAAAMEAHLRPGPIDYTNRAELRALLESRLRAGLDVGGKTLFVTRICDAFLRLGRWNDALAVLEVYASPEALPYGERQRGLLHRLLRARLHGADGDVALLYVCLLTTALRAVGRYREAASVLESYLTPAPLPYDDRPALTELFRDRLYRGPQGNATDASLVDMYLASLANALTWTKNETEALAALEAHLRGSSPEPIVYDDREALHQLFGERFGLGGGTEEVTSFVSSLAVLVGRVHSPAAARTVLESYLTGRPILYRGGGALALLRRLFGTNLRGNNTIGYVVRLTAALEGGSPVDAAAFIDDYVCDFNWLDEAVGLHVSHHMDALMSCWLRLWPSRPGSHPEDPRLLDACNRMVAYLRRTFRLEGLTREDRERSIDALWRIRTQIPRVAAVHAHYLAPTSQLGHRWLVQGLIWDSELCQRMLLERFLQTEVRTAGGDGASLPTPPSWPLTRWPKPQPSGWPHHRPPRGGGLDPIRNCLNDWAVGPTDPSPHASPVREAQAPPPPWQCRAEEMLQRGVDENDLAKVLGPDTVLCRASVLIDGTLTSAAFRSDGCNLTPLVNTEMPGAGVRIAWATARHDLRVEVAYLNRPHRLLLSQMLHAYRRRLPSNTVAPDVLEDLVKECQRHPGLEELAGRLTALLGHLLKSPDGLRPDEEQRWMVLTAKECSETFAKLARTATKDLAAELDAATEEFLQDTEQAWGETNLSLLAEHLRPEDHLVVQVEGVLHAVPVPLLRAKGKRLFEHVRSDRHSLCLMLDMLQAEVENEMRGSADRLVSAAWFRESDEAWQGAYELFAGLEHLVGTHKEKVKWAAAAENPQGSVAVVRQMLSQGRALALVLYGHGSPRGEGGLTLAPSGGEPEWDGSGIDLSSAEFLLLVSCCLGRLRGGGYRDVEGFCVRLAINRARSVLAARWPVQCQLAADVANEVIFQYLKLRSPNQVGVGGPLTTARIRAEALHLARKALLSDWQKGQRGLLNTLAAFELWGLA